MQTAVVPTTLNNAAYWSTSPAWTCVQGLVIVALIASDFSLSWMLSRRAAVNDAKILRRHLDAYSAAISEYLVEETTPTPEAATKQKMESFGGRHVDLENGDGSAGSGFWSTENAQGIGSALLLSPAMPSMVATLRDGMWKWIPYSLLVPDDLVVLSDSSPFLQVPSSPTNAPQVGDAKIFESVAMDPQPTAASSEAGGAEDGGKLAPKAFPPPLPPNAVRMLRLCKSSLYLVREAPLRRILRFRDSATFDETDSAESNPQRNPTVFRAQLQLWLRFERWVCLSCALVAVVLGIVQFVTRDTAAGAGGSTAGLWGRLFLLQPATVALLCLPVARPFLFHALNLLQLSFILRTTRQDVDVGTSESTGWDVDSSNEGASKRAGNRASRGTESHSNSQPESGLREPPSVVKAPSLAQHFFSLLMHGQPATSAGPQTHLNGSCLRGTCSDAFSLADRLGSLTVFTCINLGVISESPPRGVVNGSIRKYIDQLCVITPRHSKNSKNQTSPRGYGNPASVPYHFGLTVLDLQPDNDREDEWQTRSRKRLESRSLSTANIFTGSIYKGQYIGTKGGPGAAAPEPIGRLAARNNTASLPQPPGGIKFQDSNWRKHLSSLKPLGLSALVHSNPGRSRGTSEPGPMSAAAPPGATNRQYFAAAPDFAPQRLLLVPYITRSSLHLEELAAAIGFSMNDLHNYLRHHSSVCVIDDEDSHEDLGGVPSQRPHREKHATTAPTNPHVSSSTTKTAAPADGHDAAGTLSSAGDSGVGAATNSTTTGLPPRMVRRTGKRRSTARLRESAATIAHLHKPLLCNHVMQDIRYFPNSFLSPYQCFLAGDAMAVIRRCARFWDGTSAENSLTPALVQRLREQCSQWAAEGRNITAFGYTPTPVPDRSASQKAVPFASEQADQVSSHATTADIGNTPTSKAQEKFIRGLMLNALSPAATGTLSSSFLSSDIITATDCTHTPKRQHEVGGGLIAGGGNIDALAVPYQDWPKLLFRNTQTGVPGMDGASVPDTPGSPSFPEDACNGGSKSTVYLSYFTRYSPGRLSPSSSFASTGSVSSHGGDSGEHPTRLRRRPSTTARAKAATATAPHVPGEGARSGVFLGLTAAIPRLKPGIQSSIDEMTECGIRFVFFANGSFKRTKALVAKMGLDTGWNSSVSLQAPGAVVDGGGSKGGEDGWENKARMPRGIKEIREHLVKVDDVPLLVPLFTDCTPKAVQEMIGIHQENGAVVGVLGSSFHASNARIFSQSDLSIAVDFMEYAREGVAQGSGPDVSRIRLPSRAAAASFSVQRAVLGFTQAINTMQCTLRLPSMASADAMVHLIAEGRRLQRNAQQALFFALGFQLLLAFAYLLVLLLASPVDLLPAGSVMWLSLAVVPAIAIAMQWTEAEEVEMTKKRMPRLRPGEYGWDTRKALEEPGRIACYFLLRAFPTALFAVCVFIVALIESDSPIQYESNGSAVPMSNEIARDLVLWRMDTLPLGTQWATHSCVLAQNMAALVFALCAARLSLNAMHRNQSIFRGCKRRVRDEEVRPPVGVALLAQRS
eukprot:INCI17186.2.p1 GENE.INCI17186.2~~INCI17186.2.p1  ORF type:complete len:1539 (+),score=257.55 INCI17186.2:218-4834(+)